MDTNREGVSSYSINSDKDLVPVKSERTTFKTAKCTSSKIILVLTFLVLVLSVIIIALVVIHLQFRQSYEVCSSEQCIRIAASLKESMNTSVDPCDDFYAYVCGRWSREHPMSDARSTNSWFTERTARVLSRIRELLRNDTTVETPWAVSEAVKLYASCVDIVSLNALGLSPLQDLLKELYLPEIPAIFFGKPGNLTKQLARLKQNLGRDIFFGLDVSPDPKNNTRNIITLGIPTITSPFPSDEYVDEQLQFVKARSRNLINEVEEDASTIFSQQSYMKDVIREVTSNGTSQVCNSSNSGLLNDTLIARVVEDIYQLRKKIYSLIDDNSNDTLSEVNINAENYIYVDDLQRITDEYIKDSNDSLIPRQIWRPLIEELLIDYPDIDLTNKDRILVKNLDYLKQIAFLMAATNDEILEAILWWDVLGMVAPHSSENVRSAWTTYFYSDTGTEVCESRSLYCANAVNHLMGMAVSWLFVDRNFHVTMGPHVIEMLDDIRTAFAALVKQADWIDDRTKLATLEKSKLMSSAIGHPHWLFEEGVLDGYYDGMNLTEDAFLSNMLQIVKLKSTNSFSFIFIENPVNDTYSYWSTDPIDVNAFHILQANQITIPAGILQFPFYGLGLEALNYGAIGTVLGHELTHGFDNSGRHYDSSGNLRQWWTNETISEYTEKTQCFVDHYNSYYEAEVDDHIDGELTLGENIADNGGLREAVLAYKRWKDRHGAEAKLPGFSHLSSEQLLFLAFGHVWCEAYTIDALKWMLKDSHSPGRVRVSAVIKNSKEFSDAWKCPIGSKMNPKKKCQLW